MPVANNLVGLLDRLRQMMENAGEGEEGAVENALLEYFGQRQPQDLSAAPSPQNALNEQLYQAARSGDLEEVRKALDAGM